MESSILKLTTGKEISLYFHIPFCTKKCDYCHFYVLPDTISLHSMLLEGLILDIDRWTPELTHHKLVSIYFGGGTPSLFGYKAIKSVLDKVQTVIPFDLNQIEITLEANPETITNELMQDYANVGINRVSIGVQSLNDTLLSKLSRTHHKTAAINAINMTRSAGIKNISIDLMYDIPCQTLDSWQQTIKEACQLPIQHLSLYNLTIEPQTVFFKYKESLSTQLPDEESSTQMLQFALNAFEDAGLHQYEISAFARDNMFSKHNVGYWTARPFVGFGPSAFSYWEGKRFRAIANLSKYLKKLKDKASPIDFSEELPPERSRRELFAIALRMKKGILLTSFQKIHGSISAEMRTSLNELIKQGFLSESKNIIALTSKGVLFYDTVATELI